MIIKWTMSNGLVGCALSDEIELEDNLTDDEVEEIVRDEWMQRVEVSWERQS